MSDTPRTDELVAYVMKQIAAEATPDSGDTPYYVLEQFKELCKNLEHQVNVLQYEKAKE